MVDAVECVEGRSGSATVLDSGGFESRQDYNRLLPVTQAQPYPNGSAKQAGVLSVRNIGCDYRKWIICYENLPYPGKVRADLSQRFFRAFQDCVYWARCDSHSRL